MRNAIEQSIEFQQPMTANFVDVINGFDSVHSITLGDRQKLWSTKKITNTIKNITSITVKPSITKLIAYEIRTGVRQVFILSHLLFSLTMEFVLRTAVDTSDLGIT